MEEISILKELERKTKHIGVDIKRLRVTNLEI